MRTEIHGAEDIFLEIKTRCDFDQGDAVFPELKHGSLGYVQHGLPILPGNVSAEGNRVYSFYKFPGFAFLSDADAVFAELVLGACSECAAEHHLLGALGNVDKPTRTNDFWPEFADVQVPFGVCLGQAKESDIQPAAVVEIELGMVLNDGICIPGRPKITTGCRDATVGSQLCGEGELFDDALFSGYGRHAVWHTNPEVNELAGP